MSTAFAHTVEASFATLTPTAKRIASYMLANLERLGLETADQIAQQTGTSGISVGRFLRSVGYRNLDDLKRELRGAQSRPWFITDRLDAYRSERDDINDNGANGNAAGDAGDPSARSLDLELDAIRYVYQLAQGEIFARIAQRIAEADAVFILGIQSTRGISNAFYSYLEYLRPRVFYSDGMSGSYVDSLNSEFASPYLIVTDTRAYSRIARRYCEAATRRELPFALVTDLYCPWAREFPCDLIQVKTDVGQFWDSLAPLTCLFNLLLTSIVERLGPAIDQRVARNRELQRELDQFDL
ncbi:MULTISPECIES: sap1 transcriptional regulator SapR [Paraburkholderia]|jgi:DNA-binding MurR/RpiR family transcriptional regulator|uniref:RpiR family transcriptional regulator n=1 Tax=Paraburkholderia caribensis TaxID=75105 RepID=A0A9Q6S6I3_9BURK|nr:MULTISPECIES: MurR/RpiR family transcriptional regulator [Paraburkholderia]ALP65095.1 RpiR family transcriptional regulator [Paraburkholderia caribensis]AMV44486.1 RpiR family transcriptional regulator [Paraburkholderia caribensis]AUT53757.1 MurR/RpiR family transcriptional regulator [Paraburkholderia caribensis]MCO4883160.1 MurR/RpiR family transcriptional regulator [Paraburkholderia caribensis]MDR6383317.1 DNA-binding MurR/RpiR family transcriptional regulator [Paraburkholderia caribensis